MKNCQSLAMCFQLLIIEQSILIPVTLLWVFLAAATIPTSLAQTSSTLPSSTATTGASTLPTEFTTAQTSTTTTTRPISTTTPQASSTTSQASTLPTEFTTSQSTKTSTGPSTITSTVSTTQSQTTSTSTAPATSPSTPPTEATTSQTSISTASSTTTTTRPTTQTQTTSTSTAPTTSTTPPTVSSTSSSTLTTTGTTSTTSLPPTEAPTTTLPPTEGSSTTGTSTTSAQTTTSPVVECNVNTPGTFPHPTECNLYYTCSNGNLYLQNCPPGLVFNPLNNFCDWPENVDCGNAAVHEMINDQPTECPSVDVAGEVIRIPHESNCNFYYLCNNGSRVLYRCVDDMHLNPLTRVCSRADEAGCSSCPLVDSPAQTVRIPHEDNCNFYYLCSSGNATLYMCANEFHLSPIRRVCLAPDEAGCE